MLQSAAQKSKVKEQVKVLHVAGAAQKQRWRKNHEEAEEEGNDDASPFYHETPIEEQNDDDRNRTESAKQQRIRSQKNGFKQVQLLSGDQAKEREQMLLQKQQDVYDMAQKEKERRVLTKKRYDAQSSSDDVGYTFAPPVMINHHITEIEERDQEEDSDKENERILMYEDSYHTLEPLKADVGSVLSRNQTNKSQQLAVVVSHK